MTKIPEFLKKHKIFVETIVNAKTKTDLKNVNVNNAVVGDNAFHYELGQWSKNLEKWRRDALYNYFKGNVEMCKKMIKAGKKELKSEKINNKSDSDSS